MLYKACLSTDLTDPGSKQVEISVGRQTHELFIVLKDAQFFAYRNSCPHTGAPLNWQEDQFLDLDNSFIQCGVHDARFEIASGLCVAGPCNGDKLSPLKLQIEGNQILVELES